MIRGPPQPPAARSNLFSTLVLLTCLMYYTVYLREEELSLNQLTPYSGVLVIEKEQQGSSHTPIQEKVDDVEILPFENKPIQQEIETRQQQQIEKWKGETLVLDAHQITKEEEQELNTPSLHSTYFPESYKKGRKYFFYQPSGGWGNQRYILRWAILVANAMNRTLAIAPLAPHSDIWHGYNEWNQNQLLPADHVLDIKALKQAVDYGVVFLDDTPSRILQKISNTTNLKVKVHVKGHWVDFRTRKKLLIYSESEIRETWGGVSEDIVFWDKMSMWMCCVTDFGPDQVWYGRHIMFNSYFKSLASTLMTKYTPYNSVHVRRGDMTIAKDRKTAEIYFKVHRLDRFDFNLPLYIATNEQDLSWFNDWKLPGRFTKVIFWGDLDQNLLNDVIKEYPSSMKGDILGFIEQLICGKAVKWEGSRKSTFSAAISSIRVASQLRELHWSFPPKPSIRRASRTSSIVSSVTNNEQDIEEGEDLIVNEEEVNVVVDDDNDSN